MEWIILPVHRASMQQLPGGFDQRHRRIARAIQDTCTAIYWSDIPDGEDNTCNIGWERDSIGHGMRLMVDGERYIFFYTRVLSFRKSTLFLYDGYWHYGWSDRERGKPRPSTGCHMITYYMIATRSSTNHHVSVYTDRRCHISGVLGMAFKWLANSINPHAMKKINRWRLSKDANNDNTHVFYITCAGGTKYSKENKCAHVSSSI